MTPNVTATPLTGLLNASVTRATIETGSARLGLDDCTLPESATTTAGGPATRENGVPGALRVPSLKLRVPAPAIPPTARPLKVATPLVMVAVTPDVTVAEPTKLAVTVPVAEVTVLPATSTTATTGCVVSATPAPPFAVGGVENWSDAAAPGLTVIVPVFTGGVPVRVAVSV